MLVSHPALAPYEDWYADLAGVPLTVRFHARSPLTLYNPPTLDGLLSWAVVEEATRGEGLANLEDWQLGYELPVPLRCLGRFGGAGAPLWAATEFAPVGAVTEDVVYQHKRHEFGEWTRTKSGVLNIAPTKGRYMDRRVPRPTRMALAWEASGIGEPAEIARLLELVTHVGKRRGSGCGEVACWELEPLREWGLVREGVLVRNVPEAASSLLPARPTEPTTLIPFTPPYWNLSLLAPGWRTGTVVAP